MVKEVGFFSNLLCIILVHPALLPFYAGGIACLVVVAKSPSNKIFRSPLRTKPPCVEYTTEVYSILHIVINCNNVRNLTNILEVRNVSVSAFINVFNHVSFKISCSPQTNNSTFNFKVDLVIREQGLQVTIVGDFFLGTSL